MYSLYNIAKADFLQRVRSLGFLITLGAGMYLTWSFLPGMDANYSTVTLGNYQGDYTSSWIGTVTAMMASMFLSLTGFYLVNNSIDRDFKTGVGQIIATTKTTMFNYIAGKALSNFFVLLTLTLIIVLTATALALTYQGVEEFSALDLYAPFIWITLPTLLFISSLAAFTECFRRINRGVVNISFLFIFVFFVVLAEAPSSNKAVQVLDLFGTSQAFSVIKSDVSKQVKDYNDQHSIGYTFDVQTSDVKIIKLDDLHPSLKILLYRLFWLLVGIGFILTATRHFKRFDPAFEPQRKDPIKKIKLRYVPEKYRVLSKPKLFFGLLPMLKAEGKLMLKGISWWWWILTIGLFIATAIVDLRISHNYLLPVLLLLQINIWSVLGSREKIYETKQVVFTTPKVLTRQLFAGWGAGISWALLLSSATLIRLALEYNYYGLLAVIGGAIFINSLALIGGIFTGGSKFFQVIYVLLFYGLIQEVPFVDYLGTSLTALNYGMPFIFIGISLVFLVLSWIGRRKQRFI